MKLIRFGNRGEEKPGLVDKDGTIRDVSSLISDYSPETLSPDLLTKLNSADLGAL